MRIFYLAALRSQGLNQDKGHSSKRSPSGGEVTLGRGTRTTSATSSPDHSDQALSVSSDSGLSSTSLWADRPVSAATGTGRQRPSRVEEVQLKRLLSGIGLEDPCAEDMEDPVPRVGLRHMVPAQVHINGDPRPRERETDILDDEVHTGHDLHSVDSLGTLSSSCHKSSQNSLLSDGFGSPGAEEQQGQQSQHPSATEEYERAYGDARRGGLGSRSGSVTSATPPGGNAKQDAFTPGSYSTQSWVRQQQMVAAQQFVYMPEEGNGTERYTASKARGVLLKTALPAEPQGPAKDPTTNLASAAVTQRSAVQSSKEQAVHKNNNNSNNKHDEEFKSLTMDIDNSIDQLNQLIMDLDPSFTPVPSLAKRNGATHVNGSTAAKNSNGIGSAGYGDKSVATLKKAQQSGKKVP